MTERVNNQQTQRETLSSTRQREILVRLATRSKSGAHISTSSIVKAQEVIDLRVTSGNTVTQTDVKSAARQLAFHRLMPEVRRKDVSNGKPVMIDTSGNIFPW